MSKTSIFTFIAGAAIGSVVTWKIVKTKYQQLAQEEIEEIREFYKNKKPKEKKQVEETKSETAPSTVKAYGDILNRTGYRAVETEKESSDNMKTKPYTISPDDVGDKDYPIVQLNYFQDGVLATDFDEKIEDIDGMVGDDALKSFGEYEEDTVFVRNDSLGVDYEITRDLRNFSDVCPGYRD